MTKEEFIKKNDKPGVYIGAYADGLFKGLEIAEGFAIWITYRYNQDSNGFYNMFGEDEKVYSAKEILEIYLNEINEIK